MSLRARVLLAVGLVAIVVLGGAFLTTRLAERRLVDQVDSRLVEASRPFDRGLGPLGRFRPDPKDSTTPARPDNGRPRGFNEFYVALVRAPNQLVVVGTPNVSRKSLSPPVLDAKRALTEAAASNPRPYTVNAKHTNLRYRVMARTDPTSGDTFVLAAPLTAVDASTNQLAIIAFAVAGVVLVVLGLVAWWVIRLGVRPLQRMATAAVTIADDDLTRRVPEAARGTEAGDLSAAINNMLGRLEESFAQRAETDARLRRFVGDASHELRTPVQTIRGYSELYSAGALSETDQLDDAMRRTGQESVRMAKLIDELLTLARFDQARPIESHPVDLRTLADDAAADALAIQPDRSVRVAGDTEAVVAGDEHLLRQVLANVVNNALVHTPTRSAITITVAGGAEDVAVSVADEGPGMEPETARRAFERFVRADPARTREHGGSGLGLAIVQDAIRAHGGSVSLVSDLDRGTVVEFRLPR